jgi:hypothetical protein
MTENRCSDAKCILIPETISSDMKRTTASPNDAQTTRRSALGRPVRLRVVTTTRAFPCLASDFAIRKQRASQPNGEAMLVGEFPHS